MDIKLTPIYLFIYRTINELEAQLDYERLRREKLEAQLDQYRRDMADLSYRLQAKLGDGSDVSKSMSLTVVNIDLGDDSDLSKLCL